MIESVQNEKIKYVHRLLTDNRFRKKSGLFVVEGNQENERAIRFNYEPVEFYIANDIFQGNLPAGKINVVSAKVYEKLAYRGTSEGIIGLYKSTERKLADFTPTDQSSVIIIEGIEKPGNLGAVLRSCEAFGIDMLLLAESNVDIFNPNVIRSSVGCLFGMPVFQCTNEEAAAFLQQHQYQLFTTIMDEQSEPIFTPNLRGKSAIAFGTEHSGLTKFWNLKGENIIIPMTGSIDSLNLSNAVAISCYEILRQKLEK